MNTAHYATVEPNGYGWNATVGDDAVALHMALSEWGWNARGDSPLYLGVEFAQATVDTPIHDKSVAAFCWFVRWAVARWPALPMHFPTHAELDGTPEYGQYDGKTDVFPRGDPRADELRGRIMAGLA